MGLLSAFVYLDGPCMYLPNIIGWGKKKCKSALLILHGIAITGITTNHCEPLGVPCPLINQRWHSSFQRLKVELAVATACNTHASSLKL